MTVQEAALTALLTLQGLDYPSPCCQVCLLSLMTFSQPNQCSKWFVENDFALFYSSISTLNILLQMLKSLYEKKNGSSLTLTHVHKLGLRSLWKEIEQSRFYKNIARVNILRQIHQFSGFLDRGRGIYNLHSRRKRLVCSCSAFNFNGLLILTSIQPKVKSLKFWPFCVILNISRGLGRWDALL